MVDERRERLRRKYLSLGLGELAAACVFTAVAVTVAMPRLDSRQDSVVLWSALTPLLIVLVQAGFYWLLARSWVERASMRASIASTYKWFRAVDAGLLAAGLLGIVVWMPDRAGVAIAIAFVWAFGAVEYCNYFVVRLSYPIRRWPSNVGQRRTPRLVQDLNSAR